MLNLHSFVVLMILSFPLFIIAWKANKGNLAGWYILYLVLYLPALLTISDDFLILIAGYSFVIVNSLYFRKGLALINWILASLAMK